MMVLLAQNVTYTDIAKLTTRINALESFQNQTLPILFIISLLAGFALGFIYAKYFNKEQSKPFKY